MGKKQNRELWAVQTLREEEWAYLARRQHLSYREMSERTALDRSDGGLGYRLSETQLKSRLDGYRNRLKPVLEAHVEEHRERQVAELDQLSRLAQAALAQAAQDGKIDHAAAKLLLEIHTREAKLLGLDQPVQVETTVVSQDAAREELNRMLVSMGKKPIDID